MFVTSACPQRRFLRFRRLFWALLFVGLAGTRSLAAQTNLKLPEQAFDLKIWKLVGVNPERHIRTEGGAVEISIGPDDETQSVGFGPVEKLSGDFEVRGEYELEIALHPTAGFGSGPTIYLTTRSELKNTALIGRLNRVSDGDFISAYWANTVNGQRRHHPQLSPAKDLSGVLQLRRTGDTLVYSVGQTWNGPLREIRSVEIGDEDVNYLRIGVDRGGDRQPVRVRWKQVRILAGHSADLADLPTPAATAPTVLQSVSGNSIILGILFAAVICIAGCWWVARGRDLA